MADVGKRPQAWAPRARGGLDRPPALASCMLSLGVVQSRCEHWLSSARGHRDSTSLGEPGHFRRHFWRTHAGVMRRHRHDAWERAAYPHRCRGAPVILKILADGCVYAWMSRCFGCVYANATHTDPFLTKIQGPGVHPALPGSLTWPSSCGAAACSHRTCTRTSCRPACVSGTTKRRHSAPGGRPWASCAPGTGALP